MQLFLDKNNLEVDQQFPGVVEVVSRSFEVVCRLLNVGNGIAMDTAFLMNRTRICRENMTSSQAAIGRCYIQ